MWLLMFQKKKKHTHSTQHRTTQKSYTTTTQQTHTHTPSPWPGHQPTLCCGPRGSPCSGRSSRPHRWCEVPCICRDCSGQYGSRRSVEEQPDLGEVFVECQIVNVGFHFLVCLFVCLLVSLFVCVFVIVILVFFKERGIQKTCLSQWPIHAVPKVTFSVLTGISVLAVRMQVRAVLPFVAASVSIVLASSFGNLENKIKLNSKKKKACKRVQR